MNENLATTLAVIDAGWATTEQIRQANAWRRTARPQLGSLAMTQGKLRVAQVFEVLTQQATDGGLFGQVAMQQGLLDKGDLYELLELQKTLTPTLADALVMLGAITPKQAASLRRPAAAATTSDCFEPAMV